MNKLMTQEELKANRQVWVNSLILAALENLMKYDECAVLRAACRARYLDLTDGKEPQ